MARQVDWTGGAAGAGLALAYDMVMSGVALTALVGGHLRRGWHDVLAERLADYPAPLRSCLSSRRAIWLHGASVGEVQGLRALVGPLRQQFPGRAVVMSALTHTGRALAAETDGVDAAVYFPLDAPSVVRRALGVMRPELFVFSETELWPRFLRECARQGVPCVLVSGRVSERSVRRYAWIRPLMRRALARVSCGVQSEADRQRLVAVGAVPRCVRVVGNLKGEAPADEKARRRVTRVLARIGVRSRTLIIGASTHASEEVALLEAFRRVRLRSPETVLVLAPRHPERFGEVAELLSGTATSWIRFTELEMAGDERIEPPTVVLLDRIGLLRGCFPLAYLVFVGGTLVPVGGHNVLEPAAEGCAVVFGPHTDHIARISRALVGAGAARQVANAGALAETVESLAGDRALAQAIGERAAVAAAAERGAVARHLELITAARGHAGAGTGAVAP